jgi:exodeoxyribonuclease VIII
VIESLSRAAYDAIGAVNFSTLKHIASSPLAYRHACDHPEIDRAAFVLGRAAHSAVFEPVDFVSRYVVYPGATRRGREWEAFRAANQDAEIVTDSERSLAIEIAAAVHAHPVASELLSRVIGVEQTITWQDAATGIVCKGRVDAHTQTSCIDLKTTKCAAPRVFAADACRRAYHAQLAMYCDGSDMPDAWIIAVEAAAPHDVVCYRLPPDVLDVGRSLYHGWLLRVAEHRTTGAWPGMAPSAIDLELPSWAMVDTWEMEDA